MYTFLIVSLTILSCSLLWKLIYLQIPVNPYINPNNRQIILFITLVEHNSKRYTIYLDIKEKQVYMLDLETFNYTYIKFINYIFNNYRK